MVVALTDRGFLQSQAIQEAIRGLEAAVRTGGGVLLSGEPGTGRELFARAIHRASPDDLDTSVEGLLLDTMRSPTILRPFIILECVWGAEVEDQLFGCEVESSGPAPRGLDRISEGSLLHQALRGTLLLRGVTDMPRRAQARLARILQVGEVEVQSQARPAWSERARVRVMATVEADAAPDREGSLHPDLLKRVSTTAIRLPALRERREDIPALVRALLAQICTVTNTPVKTVATEAAELLAALPCRRNIDELDDVLRALVSQVPGRVIRLSDVLATIRLDERIGTFMYCGTLRQARERFEREYLAHILDQHRGRIGPAAEALGIQRTNLYRKLRQLALQRRRPERFLS